MRVGVAVESDVSDLGDRNETQKSVYHAESGAENRNYRELLAGYQKRGRLCDRSLDFDLFERQVARQFVAHQHRYFIEQLAEVLGAGLLVAHD